jgi:CRISPR-associated endonuclease/helicase Cas3
MVGIRDWNLDNRILSLNVPTGTGKTLTSLSFALKLRDRLKNEKKFTPRIIYALPFLSIIDQNYDVFEDVVTRGGKLDSRLLLKHHHLTDVNYKIEDKDEEFYKADESLLLVEGWNAEIIVTTFWQFFYTLFSNRNKLLRKFNKLANAIIILDEVQAVPHQYWQLIHDATKMLCEKFNSYVIFVTATQPLIFDEAIGEIKEITQNKEEYFRDLDRIKLIPRIETALTLEEFNSIIQEDLTNNPEKDFLIVLNTINSANNVYHFIKSLELENTENFYLSTNVIPKERLERIRSIKGSLEKKADESSRKRKVIVSTQLIEAGVDIDAHTVYRDFAPMDSINQVAGRCNRNSAKSEKGTVSIFILRDDQKEFYKYIYDPFLMSKTLDILKPIKDSIRESAILELNNKYFKSVKSGMGDEKSKENLACLSQLSFQDLSKKFKLIEDDYPKVNVFVEIDKTAAEIWNKYQDLKMEKDIKERMRKKLAIRKDFSEYVISAPEKYAHNLVAEDSDMGYISRDELPNYYDKETGFMRAGAGGGSMIT